MRAENSHMSLLTAAAASFASFTLDTMEAVVKKMCANYQDHSSRKKMIMEIELLMPQKLVKSPLAEIMRGEKIRQSELLLFAYVGTNTIKEKLTSNEGLKNFIYSNQLSNVILRLEGR